ncbi:uncharacterized protein Hap1MRO34_004151 isoform 1-T1 [Clarias gariepinus]
MLQGSKTRVFLFNESGKFPDAQKDIVERLKKRLSLQEVRSADECDVVISFVPIVSRAGTDIEAALQKIPTNHPALLVVFHHTFDENYIAPQSQRCVTRDDVFAADFLCYEDVGLLNGLTNEEALKSITDHLISIAPSTPLIPVHPRPQRRLKKCVCVSVLIAVCSTVLIYLIVWASQSQGAIPTTVSPVTTQGPYTNVTTQGPHTNLTIHWLYTNVTIQGPNTNVTTQGLYTNVTIQGPNTNVTTQGLYTNVTIQGLYTNVTHRVLTRQGGGGRAEVTFHQLYRRAKREKKKKQT